MEQIAKIQEQIENKSWVTAITVFKNGKLFLKIPLLILLISLHH